MKCSMKIWFFEILCLCHTEIDLYGIAHVKAEFFKQCDQRQFSGYFSLKYLKMSLQNLNACSRFFRKILGQSGGSQNSLPHDEVCILFCEFQLVIKQGWQMLSQANSAKVSTWNCWANIWISDCQNECFCNSQVQVVFL